MTHFFVLAFILFSSASVSSSAPSASSPAEATPAPTAAPEPGRAPRSRALPPENLSVEGLAVEKHTHGGVKTDLQRRFQHALVLVTAPDGSKSIECVDSPEREAALLGVKPPVEADEE